MTILHPHTVSHGYEPQRVAITHITDTVKVSTVDLTKLLGYAPELAGSQPFETMVFGGAHDELTHRYFTEAAALAGHYMVVAELFAELADGGAL